MIRAILRWIGLLPLPPKCTHNHKKITRWNEKDGCPMIRTECLICCRTLDEGHIYGESHKPEECGVIYVST